MTTILTGLHFQAQINLTSDRTPAPGPPGADIQFTEPEFVNTSSSPTTTTSSNIGPTPAQPSMTTSQVRPNVHEIRIDTFPFELRGFQRPPVFNISSRGQSQTASANNATQATNQGQGEGAGTEPGAEQPPTGNNESETTSNAQEPVPPFGSNPNMEFFMEVTPGSITIDSLETTVVTSAAQADNGNSRSKIRIFFSFFIVFIFQILSQIISMPLNSNLSSFFLIINKYHLN